MNENIQCVVKYIGTCYSSSKSSRSAAWVVLGFVYLEVLHTATTRCLIVFRDALTKPVTISYSMQHVTALGYFLR